MDLLPGFVYRFKIFPFLKERVLPLYQDGIRKESTVITLTDDEKDKLKSFLSLFADVDPEKIRKDMDIQTTNVIFETLEKYVSLFTPILYKVVVSDIERENVLKQVSVNNRVIAVHVMS